MNYLKHNAFYAISLIFLILPLHITASKDLLTWIVPRATCSYIQVRANDGCFALAERCKISQPNLTKYNGGGDFCNNLLPDQYVCCSAGTLPDVTPQPNADGSCKTYAVKKGDNCAAIAEANDMKIQQLEERNKKTWGFAGCKYIYPTQIICLSTGAQPMPATIPNAVCGPQVNDTKKPNDMSKLASLNPCPLNACCNKWGQCGITDEFCTASRSQTGAPGTSAPGTNGCISNCGTDIVNNGTAPASFIRLGYYESFSVGRPCLAMRPAQIPTGYYTHLVSKCPFIPITNQRGTYNKSLVVALRLWQYHGGLRCRHVWWLGSIQRV
jgi:chitinase